MSEHHATWTRDPCHRQHHERSTPGQLGDWMEEVYGPIWRGMSDFWTAALDPRRWAPPAGPFRERRPCGCEHVHCDPCACTVCDADLEAKAYVGEVRVFPVTLENPRSRPRTVTARLSGWVTADGEKLEWPTEVLPPTVELGPCQEATLGVEVKVVLPGTRPPAPTPSPNPVPDQADPRACLVAYCDLSLDGCETRPIRLALAILPRRCGAFLERCGCACC